MGEPARRVLNPAGMYAAVHKEALSLIHDIFWQCTYLVTTYTRSVRKVSSHFEYLENRLRGLVVTWQPVRGDLTVHL
jgi:hypothetical protein